MFPILVNEPNALQATASGEAMCDKAAKHSAIRAPFSPTVARSEWRSRRLEACDESCMDARLWGNYLADTGHLGALERGDLLRLAVDIRPDPAAAAIVAKTIRRGKAFNDSIDAIACMTSIGETDAH